MTLYQQISKTHNKKKGIQAVLIRTSSFRRYLTELLKDYSEKHLNEKIDCLLEITKDFQRDILIASNTKNIAMQISFLQGAHKKVLYALEIMEGIRSLDFPDRKEYGHLMGEYMWVLLKVVKSINSLEKEDFHVERLTGNKYFCNLQKTILC